MEERSTWANMYCQNHMEINGRHCWMYLIATSIGNICVVEYEQPSREIKRFLFDEDYDKAEAKFNSICNKMVSGKL